MTHHVRSTIFVGRSGNPLGCLGVGVIGLAVPGGKRYKRPSGCACSTSSLPALPAIALKGFVSYRCACCPKFTHWWLRKTTDAPSPGKTSIDDLFVPASTARSVIDPFSKKTCTSAGCAAEHVATNMVIKQRAQPFARSSIDGLGISLASTRRELLPKLLTDDLKNGQKLGHHGLCSWRSNSMNACGITQKVGRSAVQTAQARDPVGWCGLDAEAL